MSASPSDGSWRTRTGRSAANRRGLALSETETTETSGFFLGGKRGKELLVLVVNVLVASGC